MSLGGNLSLVLCHILLTDRACLRARDHPRLCPSAPCTTPHASCALVTEARLQSGVDDTASLSSEVTRLLLITPSLYSL